MVVYFPLRDRELVTLRGPVWPTKSDVIPINVARIPTNLSLFGSWRRIHQGDTAALRVVDVSALNGQSLAVRRPRGAGLVPLGGVGEPFQAGSVRLHQVQVTTAQWASFKDDLRCTGEYAASPIDPIDVSRFNFDPSGLIV